MKKTDTIHPNRKWREAVPNDRLAHLVKDLLRLMTRGMQIRMMEYAVPQGFWPYLRVLWERDQITQRELSEYVGLSEPTTHTALLALEKLGFVHRQKQPDNLRKISVSLTPAGRALKDKLIPLAEDLNAVAIRGIPKQDIEVFRRTLIAMRQNLERDELEKAKTPPATRSMA